METPTLVSEQARLKEKIAELSAQVSNLHAELSHYRSEEKEPSWLQLKMRRQGEALTRLNRRVRVQRLLLRELNVHDAQLGEDLWNTVKDKYATELDDDTVLKF